MLFLVPVLLVLVPSLYWVWTRAKDIAAIIVESGGSDQADWFIFVLGIRELTLQVSDTLVLRDYDMPSNVLLLQADHSDQRTSNDDLKKRRKLRGDPK